MKKQLLGFSLFLTIIALGLMSNSSGRGAVAGAQLTGAPGENATDCSQCHNGGNFGTAVNITLENLDGAVVTEYNPGEMYMVNLDILSNSGMPSAYGFQMVSLDADDQAVNSWGEDINTILRKINLGGRDYIEQTTSLAQSSWEIPWIGPTEMTGDVVFYACGNNCDGNESTSGDQPATTMTTITEKINTSTEDQPLVNALVSPNPAVDRVFIPNGKNYGKVQLYSLVTGAMSEDLVTNQYLDLSRYSPGAYVLQYFDIVSQKIETQKIIKL